MKRPITHLLNTGFLSLFMLLVASINVKATCNANFSFVQTPNTLTVTFTDLSTSEHEITSWLWHFGDGTQSDAHNPVHTYAQAGTYQVCLTIHDNANCSDDICMSVVVAPVTQDCHANFNWIQANNSLLVEFTNTSTSSHDITSHLWHFGDGESSDQNNPHHTYSQPGTYNVCLTITDNSGCSDEFCEEITVVAVGGGDCMALFTWEQLANTLTIHFTNASTSSHDITSYSWNFGDTHTGDGQNPNHTYTEAGTYNVCLTITDNSGCSNTYCTNVVVNPINSEDCNANFNWIQANNSLLVEFTNTSTSSHDITSHVWTFGDGESSDQNNPHHTYSQPGTYEVCLTIIDNTGCTDTYCQTITVVAVGGGDCMALFTWEQLAGTLTIHFTNASTSSHDITSYSWNFGDTHMGDGQNPNHTYAEAGTYEVCLTITDNSGCSNTYCTSVTVNPIPPGDCMALFTYAQAQNSLLVEFTDQSTSSHEIVSWLWHFGDGSSSDQHNPHHTYGAPGTYEVCLTIHDNGDCNNTYCQVITVDSVPVGTDCMALFGEYQLANSLTIQFVDSSSSSHELTNYSWNFGDGHTGDGHNPHHTYEEPGTYLVCLTIHDNSGCENTYCDSVTVTPLTPGDCMALFTYYQQDSTLTIQFADASTSSHDITSHYWTFGDGHVSDNANPHHTYFAPGTYEVCLTIHDNSDCTDTYCTTITVDSVPVGECHALFGWNQLPNTLTIHFSDSSSSTHDLISYYWVFGDGHTGDGHNPNHTYENPGTYEVCLTVHDNTGCEDTYCQTITVDSIPPGECMALFTYMQVPNTLTIHFINSSTSNHDITSYQWNFGDGHEGDGQNPYHTYLEPGTYEVCLTIHDNSDCSDTYCTTVTVEAVNPNQCHAAFSFDVDDAGFTVTFTNTSTNTTPTTTYTWTFGDGSSSNDENPTHTYAEHDNYTVCLIISDTSNDCSSDVCHIIHVFPVGEFQGEGGGQERPDDQQIGRIKDEHFNNHEHFVSIYPNPVSFTTTLQYTLDQVASVHIELSDLFGNRIQQFTNANEPEGVHTYRIDAANLNPGVYVIKVMIGQEMIVKKITVTR